MWKDPIVEEVHRIRAAIASKHRGLKGLHNQALALQRDLRARGVAVVNLHKRARTGATRPVRHKVAVPRRIAV
jgi:predicted nuclease with RNAse H fold